MAENKHQTTWIVLAVTSAMLLIGAGVAIPVPAFRPFYFVILGLALRTWIPFIENMLKTAKETGTWPAFDPDYLIPPLAGLVLDFVLFGVSLVTQAGLIAEIATLSATIAIGFGYGTQQIARDIQKLVMTTRAQPRAPSPAGPGAGGMLGLILFLIGFGFLL